MEFLVNAEIQQAVANIVLLVVTGLVGAIAKAIYTFIKTNTSQTQFSILEQVAASAVLTAEQGAIAGFVSDKKATAIAIVNEALKNAGVTNLSAEQIDAAIEAAVKQNFNFYKQSSNGVTVEVNVDNAPQAPDVTEGGEVA